MLLARVQCNNLPNLTPGLQNGLKAACPTCLTATPSAKASTFDRVTRRPRTKDTAIAFAPAAGFRAALGKLAKCLEPKQTQLAEEQGLQAGAGQGRSGARRAADVASTQHLHAAARCSKGVSSGCVLDSVGAALHCTWLLVQATAHLWAPRQ